MHNIDSLEIQDDDGLFLCSYRLLATGGGPPNLVRKPGTPLAGVPRPAHGRQPGATARRPKDLPGRQQALSSLLHCRQELHSAGELLGFWFARRYLVAWKRHTRVVIKNCCRMFLNFNGQLRNTRFGAC